MRPYGVGSDDSFCATARPLSFFGNEPGDYARIATSLTENPSIPHFVYVHVNGGHNPWQVDKADQVFGSHPLDVYDAMIRVADRQFGEMLSFIEQQNVQDKVITLFTADHGIGFGDHFDLCSYSNVYATNVNIPFVLRAPGKAPAKIDAVTSHIDVLPTLHQLLTGQVPAHLPGQPMLTAVPQEGAGRCVFSIAAYNDAYSMECQDGRKLIVSRERKTLEYYETKTDPRELKNLIDTWTEAQLDAVASPMVDFLARGANTYARRL
jgi:arylsulfatase A-like enzyme